MVDLEFTHTTRCPTCGRDVAAGTEHRCEWRCPITNQHGEQAGVAVSLCDGKGPASVTMQDIFEDMLEGLANRGRTRDRLGYTKPDCYSRPVDTMHFARAGMSLELVKRA